jgi:hypothetical protein
LVAANASLVAYSPQNVILSLTLFVGSFGFLRRNIIVNIFLRRPLLFRHDQSMEYTWGRWGSNVSRRREKLGNYHDGWSWRRE